MIPEDRVAELDWWHTILRKALRLTGWVAETTSPVLRDRPGPGVGKHELALADRARFLLGIRGRSAAVRARPLTL